MDPDQAWTCGKMWALFLKLKDKLKKSNLREGEFISYCCAYSERERGEEERNPFFFPRSTEFRRSEFVGPRTKVYLLDEGYV